MIKKQVEVNPIATVIAVLLAAALPLLVGAATLAVVLLEIDRTPVVVVVSSAICACVLIGMGLLSLNAATEISKDNKGN